MAIRSRCGKPRRCRRRTRAPDRCRSRSASRARQICSAISCSSPTRCRGRTAGTPCGSAAASSGTRPVASAASPAPPFSARSRSSTRTTAPFEQLTLSDVQQYTQPISYGISSYNLKQWMSVLYAQDNFRVSDDLTLDLGLRYDRQTLTDATNNVVPRVGFGWHPNGDRAAGRSAAATGCTTRRFAPTRSPARLTGGLDGLVTYTATPGQTGFPTLPDGTVSACPLGSADAAGVAAAGAQHHDPRRRSELLQDAVRAVRTELRPAAQLPRRVREPAQPGGVDRRGARNRAGACSPAPTTCTSTGPTSIAAST